MELPQPPDSRDRPFEPPQQNSPGIGIVVAVVAAAAAIYGLVHWWQTSEALPATPAISKPVTQAPAHPVAATPSVPGAEPNGLTVTKCVAQGQTIYSDGACPASSTRSALHIQQDLNLSKATQVAPADPPETPEATRPSQITANTAANKAECGPLEEELKHIDAMARQPQTLQTQDQLAKKKRDVRDMLFRLKC